MREEEEQQHGGSADMVQGSEGTSQMVQGSEGTSQKQHQFDSSTSAARQMRSNDQHRRLHQLRSHLHACICVAFCHARGHTCFVLVGLYAVTERMWDEKGGASCARVSRDVEQGPRRSAQRGLPRWHRVSAQRDACQAEGQDESDHLCHETVLLLSRQYLAA
mgnify:CR=1 FL=1